MSARLPVYRPSRLSNLPGGQDIRPRATEHEEALDEATGSHRAAIGAEVGTTLLYKWTSPNDSTKRPGPFRMAARLVRACRFFGQPTAACVAPLDVLMRDALPALAADDLEAVRSLAYTVASIAELDLVERTTLEGTPGRTLDRVRDCITEQADVMRAAMAGADGWTDAEIVELERQVAELTTAAHNLLRAAKAERKREAAR